MGIIKAFTSAASGVAKDQWKEFFTCDSIPQDTLMVKAHRVTNSNNNQGDDNVITDGSVFTIADGQAVVVVCQGKVVAVCTEPGEHIYNSENSKSVFSKGGLSSSVKEAARRFSFGGDIPAIVERIYYLNTKIIPEGSFRRTTLHFHFLDANTGADMDCTVACGGNYGFRIAVPDLFYKFLAGNVSGSYKVNEIIRMMDSQFATILQKSFAEFSKQGVRSYELASLTDELDNIIHEECNKRWLEQYGIRLDYLALTELTVYDKDRQIIADIQKIKVFTDSEMAAANINTATSDAMKLAAANEGASNVMLTAWTCSCGNQETAKFCRECGKPRPTSWTCSCGETNSGKFCTSCGNRMP